MRNRKARTEDELRIATDHLHYEYSMFTTLAKAMATGILGEGVLNNAVLESFVVHTRAVLDFFYSSNPHREDVIAEDFFDDPDEWTTGRPNRTATLQAARKRIGTEVAYLSYRRQQVRPDDKPWPFIEIARDVETVFRAFVRMVQEDLLGTRWDAFRTRQQRRAGQPALPIPSNADTAVTNPHPSIDVEGRDLES